MVDAKILDAAHQEEINEAVHEAARRFIVAVGDMLGDLPPSADGNAAIEALGVLLCDTQPTVMSLLLGEMDVRSRLPLAKIVEARRLGENSAKGSR